MAHALHCDGLPLTTKSNKPTPCVTALCSFSDICVVTTTTVIVVIVRLHEAGFACMLSYVQCLAETTYAGCTSCLGTDRGTRKLAIVRALNKTHSKFSVLLLSVRFHKATQQLFCHIRDRQDKVRRIHRHQMLPVSGWEPKIMNENFTQQ